MDLGRRHLLAVLQRIPAREVALRTGVSTWAVYKWSEGVHVPGPQAAAKLEVHLRIPRSAWAITSARAR